MIINAFVFYSYQCIVPFVFNRAEYFYALSETIPSTKFALTQQLFGPLQTNFDSFPRIVWYVLGGVRAYLNSGAKKTISGTLENRGLSSQSRDTCCGSFAV